MRAERRQVPISKNYSENVRKKLSILFLPSDLCHFHVKAARSFPAHNRSLESIEVKRR